MLRRLALGLLALATAGCPAVNARPCAQDSECDVGQRCRRGACGPICLADTECGSEQVCQGGACVARPECAADTDCAALFTCQRGACRCTTDAACAANQVCEAGSCVARARCTADADCAGTGKRCEVSQGICLPTCVLPTECAPDLDPRVAFALYTCVQGTCTRRCLNDVTCGGQGLICRNGLCSKADCTTKADCPAGQYCTSATFGRCLAYTPCTQDAQCERNFECEKFVSALCPPGFDCTQAICQELPRCFIDADCRLPNQPPAYCGEGHCQPTAACAGGLACAAGKECVSELCVPAVCRGHADCAADQACSDGRCLGQPLPGDVVRLVLTPGFALLEEGDAAAFDLVAFRLDGASVPLVSATFDVLDAQGQPSSLATVTAAGVLTAVAPGKVVVRAQLPGAGVQPVTAQVTILPAVTTGRRVVVTLAETGAPVAGARVQGCLAGACGTPTEVTTDADGVAAFPALGAGPAHFTAVDPRVRAADGLPLLERASALGVDAADLLLPLRPNPVHAAAGFNAGVQFTEVHTTGQYWAGYVAAAAQDLASWGVSTLLGETFQETLPGLGQEFPVPSSVVLYTSPGFGIPQEVKGKSLGLAQAGSPRAAVAFAGRADLAQALALRSTEFLAYLGAFDFSLRGELTFAQRAKVADASDVDGDGLCSNAQKCPQGTEDVPDWANFTPLAFTPNREQLRRTEVVLPRVPSSLDTVLVGAVELASDGSALPMGLSSRAAGPPAGDGTRPVDPVLLRSGAPYGGVEVATPGLWALAANAQGTLASGRLLLFPALPRTVQVPAFLGVPAGATWTPSTRTFRPQQPEWANAFAGGAELARVSVTGSQQRHVVYFAAQATQPQVDLPAPPTGPGVDPTSEAGTALEVVLYDLAAAAPVSEAWSLRGPNLGRLSPFLLGYARFDRTAQ